MSQYRDSTHAIIRALNAGQGRPKPAQWQEQYSSGYRESQINSADILTGMDRLLADSMARALIHRALTLPQWLVLVVMYSSDEQERVSAVDKLAGLVGTNAGPRNRRIWIGCWAMPALQMKYGKQAIDWDANATPETTLNNWRREIRKELERHRESACAHLTHVLRHADLIAD